MTKTEIIVYGNRADLISLVQNLLDNALKFTPAGETIVVDLKQKAGRAILEITDSGIGLQGDHQRLFERFYRAPAIFFLSACQPSGSQLQTTASIDFFPLP